MSPQYNINILRYSRRIISVNIPRLPCRTSGFNICEDSMTCSSVCLHQYNLGVHVQGLADAFILLGLPFDSPEAIQLNKEIFEAIYYAGLRTSCEIAQKDGTP